MKDGDVPKPLLRFVARRYSHYLRGNIASRIVRLEFHRDKLPIVLFALSQALKPDGYYSHVVINNEMFVVLPGAFVQITRGDRESLDRAIALAISHDVPRSNTAYAAMFDVDHPEMHDIEEPDW
jgi:hypothetical protein